MNNRGNKILFFLLGIPLITICAEYLYPVGKILFEDTEKIAVIYQKQTDIQLLWWDPVSKDAIKALTHYTPAGLVIMPSCTAFSFIDHQRIRIKELLKKSPKALDLHPLYDFSLIHWINDSSCYCSARERMHYNLFHITNEGDFFRLTRSSSYDYVYPQKINDSLFYIKKQGNTQESIEKTEYPTARITAAQQSMQELANKALASPEALKLFAQEDFNCLQPLIDTQKTETIFTCQNTLHSISFLTMTSETEGFFLEHLSANFLNTQKKTVLFTCYHLLKNTNHWQASALFTFEIPLQFLYGKDRLYESVLRLCPLYTDQNIFFVSGIADNRLDVYRYCTQDTSVTCLTEKNPEPHAYFSPCSYNKKIFYGGKITSSESSHHQEGCLTLVTGQNGQIFIELPFFTV